MEAQPGNSITSILVVDDSVVQRGFAVDLCVKLGIAKVHQAADGRDALSQLRSMTPLPDVVIIDLEMPGMDGIELMQQMHEADLLIPVIIASGRDQATLKAAANLVDGWGLPLLGMLAKPLNMANLSEVLAQYEP